MATHRTFTPEFAGSSPVDATQEEVILVAVLRDGYYRLHGVSSSQTPSGPKESVLSAEVVLRSQSGTDVPLNPVEQMQLAQYYAPSSLLPGHLRNKPENVFVILSGARALNVPGFWALQSMFVVDGKLSMSADLMRALVLRAGHKVRTIENPRERSATVTIIRNDDPDFEFSYTFSMEDAKTAELLGKANWKKYPRPMLVARATSAAVRTHCSDVLFGVIYTPEELGAEVNEDGAIIDGEVDDGNSETPSLKQVALMEQAKIAIEAFDISAGEQDLKKAGDIYVNARDRLGKHLSHPNDRALTIEFAWANRLLAEIERVTPVKDRKIPLEAGQERLRLIWVVASGTGMKEYETPVSGSGKISLQQLILDTISAVEKAASEHHAETNEEAIQMLKDGGIEGTVIDQTPADEYNSSETIRAEAESEVAKKARESWQENA